MRLLTLISQKSAGFKAAVGVALVTAFCLLIIGGRGRQEAEQIAAAPHLTAEDLTAAYEQKKAVARRKFDQKFIVLTGYVSGLDEGLIGDGAVHMGAIECNVGGEYGSCRAGQTCTLVGTCDGIDAYGSIHFSNCRTLP